MEVLQFAVVELQGMVNLQCRFDGVVVRSLFALATPVVPLMMLMACAGLECWAPSYGISVALQVLTIFFIGGASGSSKLFNCQRFDGGKVSLGDYAFHPVFPHLLCSETTGEAAWVRGVGTTTAIGYGIIVPAFLAFLLLKQHVAMRPSRTFFAKLKRAHGSTILQIHSIKEIEPQKGVIVAKRLMAAAAAHVAVHVKGEVQLELQDEDGSMIVTPLQVHDGAALEDDFSIPDWGDKIDKLVLRQHSLMQMLTERILLEDLKDAEFDRVLVGAKRLLCKYATFRDVWMEVLLKLVAAALVSVVSTKDGLMLSVALMLGMAIIIGVMSPYARPQINTLQSLCFTCLAVSAVGFYQHYKWLSRMALALPFLLLPVQALRPDSAETLALRIYQELENNIDVILKGEPVKVFAQQVRLL
ncbi:LRR receptor-like serine/threonine-protein kinase FLS2 [Durusdinium trenchii]|uniref:LRR receptor-like serine/threonine-protein kinase FLS2 n=1 Tax=Durusdinium trenchii TaxID=1381693 RepID=A0ABP0NFZ3_9DINO